MPCDTVTSSALEAIKTVRRRAGRVASYFYFGIGARRCSSSKEVEVEHQSRCLPEQIEPHRCAHFVVATRARMDSISAVEGRIEQIGVPRILNRLVEIDDAVERRPCTHPVIDFVADARLDVVPAGIVLGGRAIVARDDCRVTTS